jgi:hypothetical protein
MLSTVHVFLPGLLIINDCPTQLALKIHTNFGCAAKLVDRFPLLPVSCYEACDTFNYVTNANCDGTIIYNNSVVSSLLVPSLRVLFVIFFNIFFFAVSNIL